MSCDRDRLKHIVMIAPPNAFDGSDTNATLDVNARKETYSACNPKRRKNHSLDR